jgi:hypothetical protein
MIAQDPRGQRPLVTFRMPQRVDELDAGQRVAAVRIADHRPAYLTYEGPISGDRGTVRRLASGTVVQADQRPDGWRLEIRWETPSVRPCPQRLRVSRPGADGEAWAIEALGAAS